MTQPDDPHGIQPPSPKRDRPPIRIADPDGRPDVLLTADTHLVTDAMTAALVADPDIYQRSNELVHVIRHEDEDDGRHAVGTPLVRTCPTTWIGDRVSMFARCLSRGKKGEWKHCAPPPGRVKAVVERGSWRGIRHLDGVIEAPSMRPDGVVIQQPGHDEATRTLYIPNAQFRTIPESPTHSDAVLSYAHLADVFRDFPYVNEEHKSATIAALLTLLARPAISGAVPCWAFDAAAKRSGKSLQMDVVHIIASGRSCSRMTFPDNDEKELESVLAAYALGGARVVPFDNIRNGRPFGGAPIDKCVTATDDVDLRILGKTELRRLPWRATILASGNNISFCGDMIARVLCPRLESPLENPEMVSLRDLRAFALENRTSLVADALTILRAYVVAGRPDQGIRWGGFEQWAALVPSSLVWAGAPNPMGARRGTGATDDDDPTRVLELTLAAGWASLCEELDPLGLTGPKALAALYPAPKRDEPPDGRDELREAIDSLTNAKPGFTPSAKALGCALRALKSRPLGGVKLVSHADGKHPARWRAVKV